MFFVLEGDIRNIPDCPGRNNSHFALENEGWNMSLVFLAWHPPWLCCFGLLAVFRKKLEVTSNAKHIFSDRCFSRRRCSQQFRLSRPSIHTCALDWPCGFLFSGKWVRQSESSWFNMCQHQGDVVVSEPSQCVAHYLLSSAPVTKLRVLGTELWLSCTNICGPLGQRHAIYCRGCLKHREDFSSNDICRVKWNAQTNSGSTGSETLRKHPYNSYQWGYRTSKSCVNRFSCRTSLHQLPLRHGPLCSTDLAKILASKT